MKWHCVKNEFFSISKISLLYVLNELWLYKLIKKLTVYKILSKNWNTWNKNNLLSRNVENGVNINDNLKILISCKYEIIFHKKKKKNGYNGVKNLDYI